MPIQDPKPVISNSANVALNNKNIKENPFVTYFERLGQYIINHRKYLYIKAEQTFAVIKDVETNSTEYEGAFKDLYIKLGTFIHLLSKGTKDGQNILNNPAAFEALEELVASFESHSYILEKAIAAYEGRTVPQSVSTQSETVDSQDAKGRAEQLKEPIPPVITEADKAKLKTVFRNASFLTARESFKLTPDSKEQSANDNSSNNDTSTGN